MPTPRFDQIVGEAALQPEPPGEIVDRRDAVALGLLGAGDERLGVGRRGGARVSAGAERAWPAATSVWIASVFARL